MEEQKTKNEGTEKTVKQQKLTYEQLNDACNQLWQQNQQLVRRNKDLEQFSMYKRLDYLFKVLEFNKMFESEFVVSCVNEIQEGMTVTQPLEESEEKGN